MAPLQVLTLAELAATGDERAVAQLTKRPPKERTAEESVALDRGKIAKHLRSLAEMQVQFTNKPELLSDPEWLNTLRAFITYDRTSDQALLVTARLPGESGPDLLYRIWKEPGVRPSTAELARQLLHARDVRTKASKALGVAIDLDALTDPGDPAQCDRVSEVLEKAVEVGDRRSLGMLGALKRRGGCGPKHLDDCFPCLRKGSLIADATRAVRSRPAPKTY